MWATRSSPLSWVAAPLGHRLRRLTRDVTHLSSYGGRGIGTIRHPSPEQRQLATVIQWMATSLGVVGPVIAALCRGGEATPRAAGKELHATLKNVSKSTFAMRSPPNCDTARHTCIQFITISTAITRRYYCQLTKQCPLKIKYMACFCDNIFILFTYFGTYYLTSNRNKTWNSNGQNVHCSLICT